MAVTDVGICNSAFLMVGADEINSFSENTLQAKLASSLYSETKESLLYYHPWRFSLKQQNLGGSLSVAPVFEWQYRFQLPSDCLRIIQMEDERDYEVFGREIYTNTNPCRIIYQKNVSEVDMPAYFVRPLTFHLARVFSVALQEDINKFQLFDRAADKETARARQLDAQQQPNSRIPDIAFTAVNVRG